MKIDGIEGEYVVLKLSSQDVGILLDALWHDLGFQVPSSRPRLDQFLEPHRLLEKELRDALDLLSAADRDGVGAAGPPGESVTLGVEPKDLDAFAKLFFTEARGWRMEAQSEAVGYPAPSDWFMTALSEGHSSEQAWAVTLGLLARARDDAAIADIAAGPLEDIIERYGERFGDRILQLARTDSRFKQALGAVWGIEKLPSAIAGPLAAILNRDKV
jgi:hypothetical protein